VRLAHLRHHSVMGDPRWDNDDRLEGAADAAAFLGPLEELVRLAALPHWVAEDPAAHLGPGLRNAADAARLAWLHDDVTDDGVYSVALAAGADLSKKELRRAVWTVLGAIAEANSHVLESRSGDATVFEVVTGMPASATEFATHGHTVRIVVTVR
jgi:hypothetical protein